MNRLSVLAVCAAALPVSAGAGTITEFNDLAAFTAAVGSTVVEDFGLDFAFPITTGVLNSETDLVTDSGGPIVPGEIVDGVTFSTPLAAGLFFNIDSGAGFTGGFLDRLSGTGVLPLMISFDVAQNAFGFVTNDLMSAFDITILFSGGGSTLLSGSVPGSGLAFFGYSSSVQDIIGASIIGTGGGAFAFAIDDFRFTTQPGGGGGPIPPIPLPASGLVLVAGLAGLAGLRRRRRG